eukprot:TRINITY_DN10420_c0_g1_i1.p1 TRINITY_DN10420_c0_g1~~TRINITY_DN10420_c0_g1_i1.p1  ORF type:complete len:110 (-),score=47.90 TRINITY_DN10420_c0_g1_i1:31-360(-)
MASVKINLGAGEISLNAPATPSEFPGSHCRGLIHDLEYFREHIEKLIVEKMSGDDAKALREDDALECEEILADDEETEKKELEIETRKREEKSAAAVIAIHKSKKKRTM